MIFQPSLDRSILFIKDAKKSAVVKAFFDDKNSVDVHRISSEIILFAAQMVLNGAWKCLALKINFKLVAQKSVDKFESECYIMEPTI